jgi:hypothetical protein
MMSDQAIAFLRQSEFGETYACAFCGRERTVPHGADLPECSCPTSVLMRDEVTGFDAE